MPIHNIVFQATELTGPITAYWDGQIFQPDVQPRIPNSQVSEKELEFEPSQDFQDYIQQFRRD